MRFGLQIIPEFDSVETFIDEIQEAEGLGFDPIMLADVVGISKLRGRDLYTSLSLVALHSRKAHIGPCVTSPPGRHIALTANAICSLDEISGGRAMLGLGAGDTPVYLIGRKQAKLADLRAGITFCRAFVRGRSAAYEGKEMQSNWSRPHIPVLLAGDGPRTLELAGEVADGAIIGSGLSVDVVCWGLDQVRRGMEKIGRRPGEVALWVDGICNIADTSKEAREIARRRIHIRINHNFRYGFNAVPPEHLAECERYRREYNEDDVGPGSHNADLITDYMIDRFSIAGTPDECLKRFQALQALNITGFISATPFGQQTRRTFIRRLGKEILPHLR